jgi:hypothetical protein
VSGQRGILHQTVTGSVGVGVYSFAVGGLHRFAAVRLVVQAASSALTVAFAQQITSHTAFDVTSGGFAVTSGGAVEYAVYADLGRVQITATSATPLRVQATGLYQT